MDILSKLILGDLKVSQVLYYVIANYQYKLDKELVEWAECECNGYPNLCVLPDYRYIDCKVYARYVDNFGNEHDEQIDVNSIDNYLRKHGGENALVSKMRISQSIESLENAIVENSDGSLVMYFPSGMSEMIKQWYHTPAGCHNFSVYQSCHLQLGKHILSVVKSKLVDVLKNMKPLTTEDSKTQQSCIPLVFISHASKDKLILKPFVDNILKKGLGLKDENIVFTSYEATGVVPGDNIPEYIKRNIAGASVVLAMVSKNYKASEVCMNEVGAAWALGKTPVQIMLPNTNIDKLGWLIHLDKAARIDDKDSLDSLEEVICNGMGLQIPTAKHWNPCTRDFLEALKNIPDLYNEDEPECSVVNTDGTTEIICTPQYKRVYYLEKRKEDKPITEQKDLITEMAAKGFIPSIIASRQKSIESVKPVTTRIVRRETNKSLVKIKLLFKNNSNAAIENGKILFWVNNDSVIFFDKNVTEHNMIMSVRNMRIHQQIHRNKVEEDFPKPINPTAIEKLYDFYVSAPHDINSFQIFWKLESLKEPKFGSIRILWKSEYIDFSVEIKAGDERIGTAEILDYIEEE